MEASNPKSPASTLRLGDDHKLESRANSWRALEFFEKVSVIHIATDFFAHD
jgi:hypothetical protein